MAHKLHLTGYLDGKSKLKLPVAGGLLGPGGCCSRSGVATVSVVALTIYFLIALPGVKKLWLSLIARSRRERVGLLTDEVFDRVGGFMLGNLLTSVISAVGTYLWLVIFGVPYALLLALVVAVFDLIPMVGSTIAGVIVSLVALSKGLPIGIATACFYIAYRFLEDYLLNPRVMKHTVKVTPGLTIIATLIGGSLLGIIGASIAIPIAATIHLLLARGRLPPTEPAVSERQSTRMHGGLRSATSVPRPLGCFPRGNGGTVELVGLWSMDTVPQPPTTGLPVEDVVEELRVALAGVGAAVLQAEPGAGKTTVVPLRLLDEPWMDGRMLLLEPRRVAARAAAARMAALLGERVGETVGISTRDERRVSAMTRIEVVTDGILTRRLQRDPALEGVALVIFDEFHERHLQADLGLALTLDAREGLRPELTRSRHVRDTRLERGLGSPRGCPGRVEPGTVVPDRCAVDADAIERPSGSTASPRPCVMRSSTTPGMSSSSSRESERSEPPSARSPISTDVDVLPLHGTLSAAEQDRALRSGSRRRVIVSTDIAESSVTVEGVSIVIDSGLARRPAFDPASGLSRVRTITTSRASADQRAGRAGRNAPASPTGCGPNPST